MKIIENKLNDNKDLYDILSNQGVSSDLVQTVFGTYIGAGASRMVYDCQLYPNTVIKVEYGNSFDNVKEYALWEEINYLCGDLAWVKDWFAPIKWISPNGKLLVMDKTFQNAKKEMPERIPDWLWDVKVDNFGWIGNKFVCHDYAYSFHALIQYKKKFKKNPLLME